MQLNSIIHRADRFILHNKITHFMDIFIQKPLKNVVNSALRIYLWHAAACCFCSWHRAHVYTSSGGYLCCLKGLYRAVAGTTPSECLFLTCVFVITSFILKEERCMCMHRMNRNDIHTVPVVLNCMFVINVLSVLYVHYIWTNSPLAEVLRPRVGPRPSLGKSCPEALSLKYTEIKK
jgi:hypothetical protein